MLGKRGVLVIAAHALMRGDAFALVEDLDGAGGEPRFDFATRKAVGDAVVVRRELDVIVDADAADAPFRQDVGLGRQGLQRRPVDLLEQLAPGHAETADRPFFVEPPEKLADRGIDLTETEEGAVAHATEEPALDRQHRLFDLRLVARPPRPGRQNGGAIVRRHVGIGAVDLRIVEAGLDHRRLGVVGNHQLRHSADRCESARMRSDPIGKALRPGRLRIGEARCPQHRDEDLRVAKFTGEPVDNDWHAVARIIDKQLLACRVALAHRHRQPSFPATIKFAEPRVAITVRFARDVFLPDDRQRDVLALQRTMHFSPIRLSAAAVALLGAGSGEQLRLKGGVGEIVRQRPIQPGRLNPLQRQPNRRRCNAKPPRNLAQRHAGRLQPHYVAHLAHRYPLAWHPQSLFR